MNLLHVTGYGSSPNPSPVWIHSPHNCGNKSFFCQLRSNTSPHNISVYFYGEFWKVSLKNAFVSIICIQWNSFNLSQSSRSERRVQEFGFSAVFKSWQYSRLWLECQNTIIAADKPISLHIRVDKWAQVKVFLSLHCKVLYKFRWTILM